MSTKQYECLLPEQRLTDSKCIMKTEKVVDMSTNIKLEYSEVVNVENVTGLDTDQFRDKYSFSDIKQLPSSTENVQSKSKVRLPIKKRGTIVNFLDKFRDPENVPESETWDVDINSFDKTGKNDISRKKYD